MRTLSRKTLESIKSLENFIYCFHIIMPDQKELLLTESDKVQTFDGKNFIPNSGLTLIDGQFNDSSKNYIILKGIFEDGGIESGMNLTGSNVKIYILFETSWEHFLTYKCTSINKEDLSFSLELAPLTKLYNQSILLLYSKTCRANFGDIKCKINKQNLVSRYSIKEIYAKTVIVSDCKEESGYFSNGEAVLSNIEIEIVKEKFFAKILKHYKNSIFLDRAVPDEIKQYKIAKLTPGCDKNFITCCNKFNNAVNFRGEPFIPTDDFIKVI